MGTVLYQIRSFHESAVAWGAATLQQIRGNSRFARLPGQSRLSKFDFLPINAGEIEKVQTADKAGVCERHVLSVGVKNPL
jgi:hypothetical protein